MTTSSPVQGGFTGRHMLFVMIAFFAVIILANVVMATAAGRSWTGFVVRNSYVASQQYNGRVAAARAQAELGWRAMLAIDPGEIRLRLVDGQGRRVPVAAASLDLRHPASDRRDLGIPLRDAGDWFEGRAGLGDGQWVVEIRATTVSGVVWSETRRIRLRKGRLL